MAPKAMKKAKNAVAATSAASKKSPDKLRAKVAAATEENVPPPNPADSMTDAEIEEKNKERVLFDLPPLKRSG